MCITEEYRSKKKYTEIKLNKMLTNYTLIILSIFCASECQTETAIRRPKIDGITTAIV